MLVRSDNTSAVFHLNHQGGTKSGGLQWVSQAVQMWAAPRLTSLWVMYLLGERQYQDGACVALPHLSCLLSILFATALFLCVCCSDVSALLVYDRQALLNIRASGHLLGGRSATPPPVLSDVLACLHCLPCVLCRRKRSRRRGKWGGVQVRLKAYLLTSSSVSNPRLFSDDTFFLLSDDGMLRESGGRTNSTSL